MNIISDQQLLEAVKQGDDSAFAELVQRYEKQIAGTVIGMLGNCPEADDVGQETFIRFYKNINTFRGDSALGTFLTRIAINLSLNELKRRKRLNMLHAPLNLVARKAAPDPKMGEQDIAGMIEKAIHSLPLAFRTVVVLRLVEEYSVKETADILQIPTGTVLSRLARAQQKLKQMLEPIWNEHHE